MPMTACPYYEAESKRCKGELRNGDYVLASKYHDGDPCDQFAIGYYCGTTEFGRHLVCDDAGKLFRASGFRRCERISKRVGAALVKAANTIGDKPGRSVWYWRRHVKGLI